MLSKPFSAFKNWYNKDKKILLVSALIGMSAMAITAFAVGYSEDIQNGISEEIIRFHVLANSDSEQDQNLKLLVRDGIIEDLKDVLSKSNSLEQTRALLNENLDRIVDCAENIIIENGFGYSVTAEITTDIFPTRVYGDAALPAGKYEALRVEIGEAKGKNWWCVMFPPLCFVDITQPKLPESAKQEFKSILSEEQYNIVNSENAEFTFKLKFKVVELWQGIKYSFTGLNMY